YPSSSYFFLYRSAPHRHLHSFPTRRSSDLAEWLDAPAGPAASGRGDLLARLVRVRFDVRLCLNRRRQTLVWQGHGRSHSVARGRDRKSTRLNSSHRTISYAVFCLKKKKKKN